MLAAFLTLAAQSPTRQRALRRLVVAHLAFLGAVCWVVLHRRGSVGPLLAGQLLLCAGIVEGAVLLGWRLTQLPKSQALEFLLVTSLQPRRVFLGEATVGLMRLGLVTLAGLPVLLLLLQAGVVGLWDIGWLLLAPYIWGAVTGLGLTAWAYEPLLLRRWGERICMAGVLVYLAVGVLAAENLQHWLGWLPSWLGEAVYRLFRGFHHYNPFGAWQGWVEEDPAIGWQRMAAVQTAGLLMAVLLLARGAWRLHGHFHDLHYRPHATSGRRGRPPVGDQPLSWWAVRRVTQYSGRVNLWLAGGFGLLYAACTVAGPYWPTWLGRRVFDLCDHVGGIPVIAAALVVLAAVPAAFQYGLWDSSTQDRCRRLELLLLTGLGARDYWSAATAAAWKRGRGYFAVAAVLWLAAVLAGKLALICGLAALTAGVLLWAWYFALGFRAFSRGMQANGLGMALTLGLPLVTVALYRAGWLTPAVMLPPGAVYWPASGQLSGAWLAGMLLCGGSALTLAWLARRNCLRELRDWYDHNHGRKVAE